MFGQMRLELAEMRAAHEGAADLAQRLNAAADAEAHCEAILEIGQFAARSKEEVHRLSERLDALVKRYPALLQRCMQQLPKQVDELEAKSHPKVFFRAVIPVLSELLQAEKSGEALSECKKALKHNM